MSVIYEYGDWRVDEGKILGGGTFGKVYMSYKKDNPNKIYAAKCIPLTQNTQNINKELTIFNMSNNCPYIVTMHHFLKSSSNKVIIFMDYCNEGSLSQYVKSRQRLDLNQSIDFLRKLIQGYYHLRSHNVMHRDLKPDNVLIDNSIPRLTDFGLSKICDDYTQLTEAQTKTLVGSEYYMAPELLNFVIIAYQNQGRLSSNPKYSDKCDVWSMGMIFYFMLVGQIPWKYDYSYTQDMSSRKNGTSLFLENILTRPIGMDSNWPLAVQHLLVRMLNVNEQKRISWEEIFEHPLIDPNIIQKKKMNPKMLEQICIEQIEDYIKSYPPQNQYQFQYNPQNSSQLYALNKAPNQQQTGSKIIGKQIDDDDDDDNIDMEDD